MISVWTSDVYWLTIVFAPLVLAVAFLGRAVRPLLIKLAPWMALPALVTAMSVDPIYKVRISWLFFDAQFGMDPTAKTFLFFTALIWLVAGLYSMAYIKFGDRKVQYFVYFLLAMCGNLGLVLAQDVFSFYFLFALMSFASYGLVIHSRSEEAYQAGSIYIILVVIGEVLIFSSLLIAASVSSSIYFPDMIHGVAGSAWRGTVVGLALFGFGIKVGMFPLHVWLPLAHPVAPTPASAILSGSMINAGFVGWLRVFPMGEVTMPSIGWLMIGLGIFSALYAVVVGVTQRKVKAVLAYSSISQMGVMTMLFGIGFLVPEVWLKCWPILMIYATHHALAKCALFLSVGVVTSEIKSQSLRFLRGIGLCIPALAVIGFPFTAGAYAKGSFKYMLKYLSGTYEWGSVLMTLLMVSAFATTLLLARFLYLVWPTESKLNKAIRTVPGVYISWGLMVLMVLLVPLLIHFQEFISVSQKVNHYAFKISKVWVLILAAGVALLALKFKFQSPWSIPAGDILNVYQNIYGVFRRIVMMVVDVILKIRHRMAVLGDQGIQEFYSEKANWEEISDQFGHWKAFGMLFMLLFVIFLGLLT